MNQPDPQRRIAGGVEYELTRRRVRNLNIRVRTDGSVAVSAPRDMSTRWGSCSLKTGTLCFALRLCVMPLPAQEYVVVHEFCHFAHPNHSPAFWAAVARVMPDYKARQALLRGR